MAERARQLVLDLPVAPRFEPEDFLVGASNEAAYGLVEAWPDWPDRLLLLQGPRGCGKSHLAAIWAARAGAPAVPAASVVEDLVRPLGTSRALLIEDLDRGPLDEDALFHLVNRLREGGAYAIVTSSLPVEGCGLRIPDLRSRLRLAPAAILGEADDALLRAGLVKLFIDRQLVVDTRVVDYVAARIERSLAAAAEVVAALDREALSRGRRVTRRMAATVLSDGPGGEDSDDE